MNLDLRSEPTLSNEKLRDLKDPAREEYIREVGKDHEQWEDEAVAYSRAHLGDLRDGFIAGYLQAYRDTEEYACTVRVAEIAHAQFVAAGRIGETPKDVAGW